MFGNAIAVERMQIVSAFVPVDFNAAAQTGDWVSLKDYRRCACVLFGAAGSSGTDLTVTIEQATSVAGAGAKALDFTRIDKKEGAALTAIGEFTEVTQAAGNTFTTANNEQTQQIYVIDFGADDLDVANNFDCLNMSVNAGNAAKVVAGLYILYDPKHGSDPLPSAIAN